jgi:hypothetical protein
MVEKRAASVMDLQDKLYQQGKRLEARGNALLSKAKAKFAEAYAAGWANDGDIGAPLEGDLTISDLGISAIEAERAMK